MKRTDIKRRPLADTTLSSLEPEAGAYRELDSPGLYFRVKPNGQKSWELRYKKPDGKWSWLGLGGYPEVGGAFARQKAADLRSDASEGKNPITSKKARQAAEIDAANDTFEALAREWHTSRLSGWDAGTAKRILGALERHVFPSLGRKRLIYEQTHRKVRIRSPPRKLDKPPRSMRPTTPLKHWQGSGTRLA